MSSFSLRLLALLCMCVDHAGLALFPSVGAFRCVGRLAFPLYCFLLTQGYMHTRDLRAYCRRILLLAFVSEIPFDYLIFGRIASPVEQNVLFSLFFALLALYAADTLQKKPMHACLIIITLAMAAMVCRVSFGWLSIALCLCFYSCRNRKLRLTLSAACTMLVYSLSLQVSGVAQSWVLVSFCALFSLPLLLLYNGKRGPHLPLIAAAFYVSYPLHILLLILVRMMRIIPPYFLH